MIKRSSILLGICLLVGTGFAQMTVKSKGSDGWGFGDRYDQNFNHFNVQTYYGKIKSVDTITPLPGMAYGVQLIVTSDESDVAVHLGPAWFVLRQDNMIFTKNDDIEIKGMKAMLNGKQVIMASQVKKKDRILFLRDDDGIPSWCAWRKESY
jgi:hypothetical protein